MTTIAERIAAARAKGGVSLTDLSQDAVITETSVSFPMAQSPDRQWRFDSDGVGLAVYEWGDESAPPLFLLHGGFDFARTFDVFAPLMAAGGWRVISWDHRNHGDSDAAPFTSWSADIRDAASVITHVTNKPAPIIGHSKGGAMTLRLGASLPHLFTHLVNIDGLPSNRAMPDLSNHERTRLLQKDLSGWLDHKRSSADGQRKPGTIAELAKRRSFMNQRLSHEWLSYLVTVGAKHDADGWRWKIDPMMRMGGFGPWRPSWSLDGLPGLPMPFLGLLGLELEAMAWGTVPQDLVGHLPRGGHLETFADTGHFIHIEQPVQTANIILEFLS
jgi:pimeloyl-ACP methyl ester carboxylesterase